MTKHTIDKREELIEACKRGERLAQKRLYEDYCDAMYNVCVRMINDTDDAADALQNAFIKVFKNINKFQYQSTPGAWIKRIVVNECIDHHRAKKVHFEEIKDHDAAEDVDIEDALISVPAIKAAMDKLSDGYRSVVSLYLFEGYDHTEIAEILGITVTTSKTQYHRAKKKLRELLKEYKIAC